jgi:uncharacterized metal-binding protein
MPSGRTHDHITSVCAPVVLVGSLALWQRADVTLTATFAFVAAGLMFGPDLDIYSNQVKRWGPLQIIWRPYQRMIPHRSVWSHGFLLGTAVRLLYLLLWLLALALVLGAIATGLEWLAGRSSPVLAREGAAQAIAGLRWLWQEERRIWIWSLLGGLEVGAASHYGADYLTSAFTRSRRSLRKVTKPKPKAKARAKASAARSAGSTGRPKSRSTPKAKPRSRPKPRTRTSAKKSPR